MHSIIPESWINNNTQRDEDRSDKNVDDYCVNENSDGEATILAMYKIAMELCGPKFIQFFAGTQKP